LEADGRKVTELRHAIPALVRAQTIALQDDLEESQGIVTASSHRHIKILRADVSQLHKDVAALQADVADFMQQGDIKQADDRCIAATCLQRQMNECAACHHFWQILSFGAKLQCARLTELGSALEISETKKCSSGLSSCTALLKG
jgi:hypothetical protein